MGKLRYHLPTGSLQAGKSQGKTEVFQGQEIVHQVGKYTFNSMNSQGIHFILMNGKADLQRKLLKRMMYFSVYDTGKLGKRNPECSYQESKLRPSDY